MNLERFLEHVNNLFFISNSLSYTDAWNNPKKYGITSINIETKFLKKNEFKAVKIDFRKWMVNRN